MSSRKAVQNYFSKSKVTNGKWKVKPVSKPAVPQRREIPGGFQPKAVTENYSVNEDADWKDQIAAAQSRYNTGLNDLRQAQDRARYDYGLDGDTRNPFSRANLLKQGGQRGNTSNTTSDAARGQFYSGSLDNAQTESDKQYVQGDNELQNAYRRTMENYADSERKLGEERQLTEDSARMQLVQRNLANRPAGQVEAEPSPTDYGTPYGSQSGNKPAKAQLKSYVKNGWFYRQASDGSGRMLRIRRAG